MRTTWILALSMACGGDDPPGGAATTSPPPTVSTPTTDTATPPDDTGTPPGTTDTVPLDLTGTVPPVALPVPEFDQVVNLDVTLRTQADLIGHPTVLWFYPAAGTGG